MYESPSRIHPAPLALLSTTFSYFYQTIPPTHPSTVHLLEINPPTMPPQSPQPSPPPKRSHATPAVTAAAYPRTRTPIWTRKRDLLYLIFFLVHIPVILCTTPPIFPSLLRCIPPSHPPLPLIPLSKPPQPDLPPPPPPHPPTQTLSHPLQQLDLTNESSRRPLRHLPAPPPTTVHDPSANILHLDLQRPILHRATRMVRHVHVDGSALPPAAERVGRRGSVARFASPLFYSFLLNHTFHRAVANQCFMWERKEQMHGGCEVHDAVTGSDNCWRADDPVVPLHLLVLAVQMGVTTLTCVADMMSWTAVTRGEKWALGALYGPYLALGESSGWGSRDGLALRFESHADRGWGGKRFSWGWIASPG